MGSSAMMMVGSLISALGSPAAVQERSVEPDAALVGFVVEHSKIGAIRFETLGGSTCFDH